MMNYGDIKALVKFWVHRTDLDSVMDQFFELSRERISKEARLLVMETDLHIDFTGDPEPLPADFVAFRSVRANVTGGIRPLQVATKQQLDIRGNQNRGSGGPTVYALNNNKLEVQPGADGSSIDATYYARPKVLVNDNDTNPVLENWPSLYLYAAQIYIHNSLQDTESEQVAQANFQTELDAANESDDDARYSGDSPTMTGS